MRVLSGNRQGPPYVWRCWMDTFDQKRYEQLKKELRKAIKSNDLDRIYQTATSGLEEFETIGFPDDWSMWQRAIDDVGYAKLYGKKV